MKNSKIFIGVCVVAMAMLFAVSPTKAGILSDNLSYDGIVDALDDDSAAIAQDVNANGKVDAGDLILGVLRVGSTTASGPLGATEQLVGIFVFKVKSVSKPLNYYVQYELEAANGALRALLPGLNAQFGGNAINNDAMVVVASDWNPIDPTNLNFNDAVAAINADYLLEATAGIQSGTDDFAEARLYDANDDGEVTNAEIAAYTDTLVGSEAGGFTIMDNYGLGSAILVPVEANHLAPPGGTTLHNLAMQGAIWGPNSALKANGYAFRDSTSFLINPTPEPASMAVWAAGLLCFAGASLRRRKK